MPQIRKDITKSYIDCEKYYLNGLNIYFAQLKTIEAKALVECSPPNNKSEYELAKENKERRNKTRRSRKSKRADIYTTGIKLSNYAYQNGWKIHNNKIIMLSKILKRKPDNNSNNVINVMGFFIVLVLQILHSNQI